VTAAEAASVTELFALAFHDDPTWAWAFPDAGRRTEQLRAWWGLYVRGALPHEWAWMTGDGGAAALWIPPGKPELSDEEEARVEPLLRELVGSHADDVLTLVDRFDSNHPRETPHYYLGLLATHPEHRGQGKGMGLLAANLARLDEMGMPAYLESSNRANDRRYERLGFELVGEFTAPGGEPSVGCMWRDPHLSQENVEVVRDHFAATNEGDFPRAMSHYAEDVVLVVDADAFLSAGTFTGRHAVGQWFADWFTSYERGYRFEIEEARDLGDVILLTATHHGRGRTSGAEVHGETGYLYRVRGGKIARVELYRSGAAALAAAQ
jgi:ketosteroid isomerase-like protein/GNAT superfamily N-acetyltransferase